MRLSEMDEPTHKQRGIETADERSARLDEEARKALDRALAEQDAIDAMVKRSIRLHGA